MRRAAAILSTAAIAASLLVTSPTANAVIGQVRAEPDRPLQPTANPALSRGKAGPGLTVNPNDVNHIVETHQELETEECEFNVSLDGGVTWAGGELQAPPGFPTSLPGPCSVVGHGAANIGQQSVAFGSGSNVYVTWTSSPSPGNVGYTVLLSRSTDGGRTFAPATVVQTMIGGAETTQPDFAFPEIVIDRRTEATDRIFISARDARTARALVTRSDDAGVTFVGPFQASNTAAALPTFNQAGTVTAAGDAYRRANELTQPVLGPDPDGAGPLDRPLYLAWRGSRTGACPPNCEGTGETGADAYLVVAKSSDAGATWTRVRAVNVRGFITPASTGPTNNVNNNSNFPRLAAGTGTDVHLVYNQGPGIGASANCGTGPFPTGAPGAGATNPCPSYGAGPASFRSADHFMNWDLDVWYLRSRDGGATWGDLKQINDPKKPGLVAAEITQTRHPQVYLAPDGRVDIVWHDRRHWYLPPSVRAAAVTPSPGSPLTTFPCVHTHAACPEARLGDTYYVWSTDAGATFSPNRRVNDRSHNNDVGYDYRFSTYWDYGPAAVPLGDEQLLVASHDSRRGNTDTDSQDIYLRRVNLNAGAGAIPTENLVNGPAAAFSTAISNRVTPGGTEGVLAATFASRPWTRVVIVNENEMPSALAAGVLARANLGPLLASPASSLPPSVKAEVDRMNPVGAFVIGGTTSLSPQVEADLVAAGVPAAAITRIDGTSPARDPAGVRRDLPAFDAAIIANPNSASAASASALAANRRLPILYVDQNSIPQATTEALQYLGITKTLVIGSTAVISAAVASQLPSPTRLGGGDQFATSNAVVNESVARGLPRNMVYVADGNEPMHAALLGAAVGRMGGLLTLAPGGTAAAAESTVTALGLRPQVDRIVTSDLTGGAAPVGADPSDGGTPLAGSSGLSAAIAAEIAEAMDARPLVPPPPVVPDTPTPDNPNPNPVTPTPNPDVPTGAAGYRMIAADGGVFVFGERNFEGSLGDRRLNKPIVGGASNPATFRGYWMVASDGGVFNFGDAGFFGSLGGENLTSPIVEIEPTPSGQGYFLVDARGRVYPFGDAVQGIPDARDLTLNKSIIGMTVTPTGRGYYLVASDGGIFTYGDAVFQGSMGAARLNAPVIDLAVTPDGQGYYLLGGDGGVFSFGTAEFRGSTGDIKLNKPAVAMLVAPNGAGYWFMASDGGVFTFGPIPFLGSMGGTPLSSPVLDAVH